MKVGWNYYGGIQDKREYKKGEEKTSKFQARHFSTSKYEEKDQVNWWHKTMSYFKNIIIESEY